MTSRTPAPDARFVLLGEVTRPHGIRGAIRVRPCTESPENFCRYRRLYLSPAGTETKTAWDSLDTRVSGRAIILRLKGCASREEAEALAGSWIWLDIADLPPAGPDKWYLHTLEGKKARTEEGQYLGLISAILSTAGQDILVIGQGKEEYLVPAVRDFLVHIGTEEVVLRLPPGLLEINR